MNKRKSLVFHPVRSPHTTKSKIPGTEMFGIFQWKLANFFYLMLVYNNGMHYYTKDQLDKIGNTIVYLATNIKPLYKTKVLKLLYLLDEFSIKRYGIPFLNLEYKVWQAGPVCSDLFSELNEQPYLLEDYISLVCENNTTQVKALKEFSDDEFTDTDLMLLNEVVRTWGKMPAEQLVELTHRETAPWFKTAKETGLLELFENKVTNTSDVVLSEYTKVF